MNQNWDERRDRIDRREVHDKRKGEERRSGKQRREPDQNQKNLSAEEERRKVLDRRTGRSRRQGADRRYGIDRRLLVKNKQAQRGKLILGGVITAGLALSLLYYESEVRTEDLVGTISGSEKVKLKMLGGGKTTIDELLKEGPVLLDFWATWCGPCLKEMVHLQRFHEKYSGYGLTILTINQDSPKSLSKVRSVVKSKKFSFKVALDPNGKIAKRLNAKLLPTTILVDMDGVIRWMHQGYLPGDELEIESRIQALIGYQEPAPITS